MVHDVKSSLRKTTVCHISCYYFTVFAIDIQYQFYYYWCQGATTLWLIYLWQLRSGLVLVWNGRRESAYQIELLIGDFLPKIRIPKNIELTDSRIYLRWYIASHTKWPWLFIEIEPLNLLQCKQSLEIKKFPILKVELV